MAQTHWHLDFSEDGTLHLLRSYPYSFCGRRFVSVEPGGCDIEVQAERENDPRCCEECRGQRDLQIVAE